LARAPQISAHPAFIHRKMAFNNAYDARVQSVLDFDYVMPVHSSYHPIFKAAAKRRLIRSFPDYAQAITQAFSNRAFKQVWGILIEQDGQPMCVIQNLACVVKNQSYRRVLRVNLDESYPTRRAVQHEVMNLSSWRC
jgi:hypothetical protein